jgi:uncharacterized protein YigA (DUF484 family)
MGTKCGWSRPDHDRRDPSHAALSRRRRRRPRLPAGRARFPARDPDLLSDLGLRPDASNIVDFGPAALARVSAAHEREALVRRQIEATARANFSAQAQSHAAVIDLLDARNHSDLARRVDEMAILRFGLTAGVVVLEGPGRVPAGWHALIAGQIDMTMGDHGVARMGFHAPALGLFGDRIDEIKSMALVRMALWEPSRQGCWPSARPIPKASPPTWARTWWPSWPASSNARPSAGRSCDRRSSPDAGRQTHNLQNGCHPGRSEAQIRDRRLSAALPAVPDLRATRLSGMTGFWEG